MKVASTGPCETNIPGPVMSPVAKGPRKKIDVPDSPEGAVLQVEPRPGSIDFDRVAVQIVRDLQEELTGEEPLGIRAARWKVAPITLHPCRLEADRERANPRHTCVCANSRGQRDRRHDEPKDKAEKNRKPLHNSLPSLSCPRCSDYPPGSPALQGKSGAFGLGGALLAASDAPGASPPLAGHVSA